MDGWMANCSLFQWVVQLAKWAGAEVFGTAGKDRLDFAKSLGASEVFDYRNTDVRKWVEDDEGRKFDVVIHTFGLQALTDAWWLVKDGGTLISFFQPPEGAKPEELTTRDVKALFFIVKTLGEHAGQVGKLIDGGGFITAVDSVYRLERFEEAVERMESGKARGKVVLEFVSET
jgi:NADPH:quinone reductase-like Zn-dependent oxidoreductase